MNNIEATYIGRQIQSIQKGGVLSREKAKDALLTILRSNTTRSNHQWGSLFSVIQARGANQEEIMGFVDAAAEFDPKFTLDNDNKIEIPSNKPVVAITGSGKDTWKTFNISTAASFIAACCGTCVVKPGSSAISSLTGAIEVIDELSIPQISNFDVAKELAKETDLTIVNFANSVPDYAERYDGLFYNFHPLSYVMPVVAIPFKMDGVVFGIADEQTDFSLDLIAKYGPKNVAVVATKIDEQRITDELLPFGEALFSVTVDGERFSNKMFNDVPSDLDVINHGETHKENAEKLVAAISGDRSSPLTRAACMAAASILATSGLGTIKETYELALQAVESGQAVKKLEAYREAANDLSTNHSLSVQFERGTATSDEKRDLIVTASQEAGEEISRIPIDYGYSVIAAGDTIDHLDEEFLGGKFSCHDGLASFSEVPVEKRAIVTGFGPTNSPTAGTLSVILKTIGLQRELQCDTEIIISNLGAYLSRNEDFDVLQTTTSRFQHFINRCGFDSDKGVVRTHIDKENLGLASFINENALTTADFRENKEATEELYGAMNLLGSKLGIITDSTYTVADVLKPLLSGEHIQNGPHDKERVLVIAGIEEHYFPRLAQLAISRIQEKFPEQFMQDNAKVSAIYTKLIPGLAPYPKMSKSIPESAINIGDNPAEIRGKIMDCSPANEHVVFEMMAQASNWSPEEIRTARDSFEARANNPLAWNRQKQKYTDDFITMASHWREACDAHPMSVEPSLKTVERVYAFGS